jgi:multicomponent Na+:H+ antiporter subunit D
MSLLLLPIALPVLVAPILLFIPDKVRRILVFFCLLAVALFSLLLLTGMEMQAVQLFESPFQAETGISFFSFSLHPYGRIAAFGFTMVLSLGLLFGLEVSKRMDHVIALFALAGAVGVAFADNFLTFLFFWEVLTLTSTMLIFLKRTTEAIEMGYRVLFLQLAGGLSLTVGIMMHYQVAGSFALTTPAAGLPFFILGIGMKAAFLPLHVWVPWGYPAAPFTNSVLLAALCTKAGVYGVARILPPSEAIAMMGAMMAIVAVSFALVQSNMRRLLSVHIVSQVGYMVAALGMGGHYGIDGGLLHMANNMVYKALLFMCAGAVLYATGSEDLHYLHHPDKDKEGPGFLKSMPIVTLGALAGALAIAGTPLFNGYVSKYLIKKAEYGFEPVETILLVAGVGTSLSFIKFFFFGFLTAKAKVLRPPTGTMQAAIGISALACIAFGAYPALMTNLIPEQSSLHVYSLQGILVSLQIIGTAVVVFFAVRGVLERGVHAPGWANRSVDVSWATARGGSLGLLKLFDASMAITQTAAASAGNLGFRSIFGFFQKLDYRPGSSKVFRVINVGNMDFDVLLVVIIFGVLATWFLFMTLQIQIIHINPF